MPVHAWGDLDPAAVQPGFAPVDPVFDHIQGAMIDPLVQAAFKPVQPVFSAVRGSGAGGGRGHRQGTGGKYRYQGLHQILHHG